MKLSDVSSASSTRINQSLFLYFYLGIIIEVSTVVAIFILTDLLSARRSVVCLITYWVACGVEATMGLCELVVCLS